MADSVAVGRGANTDKQNKDGRTPAQWYCYLAGAALLLGGIFGFLADATFDTGGGTDSAGGNSGGALQGDSFLGFEVNGWHNVVHLLSGLFLLALAGKRKTAKTAALAFGIIYGIVTIIGLIDGNDVLGIIPVNPADNVLHIALSLAGIISGLVSDADDRDHVGAGDGGGRSQTGTGRARAHDVGTAGTARTGTTRTDEVAGRGATLRPEDHDETSGRRSPRLTA